MTIPPTNAVSVTLPARLDARHPKSHLRNPSFGFDSLESRRGGGEDWGLSPPRDPDHDDSAGIIVMQSHTVTSFIEPALGWRVIGKFGLKLEVSKSSVYARALTLIPNYWTTIWVDFPLTFKSRIAYPI
jgi:hypothetical protein